MKWIIEGFDGVERTFRTTVDGNIATEAVVGRMLQALAARHLTEAETVEALNAGEQGLLEVRRDRGSPQLTLSCGENPHYTARLIQPG